MTVIPEGDLEFTFGDTWNVLKYDEDGSFYKTCMERSVKPTKAVDFLCHGDDRPLLLLEAKDFSKGLPGKEKFDKLPMTVALKVRDTVAGIVGGAHWALPAERTFFQNALRKMSRPPRIIFFFEDLATPAKRPPQRAENQRSVLFKELKKCLRWLTKDVVVVGLNNYDRFITDLTVRRV